MATDYCTLEELQAELKINDAFDDARLSASISAASRQIDWYTGLTHGFWADGSVTTREFYADNSRTISIPVGISTTTGLIVKTDSNDDGQYATTLTIGTNFILFPVNASDQSPVVPWTQIRLVDFTGSFFPQSSSGRPGVQITAKFGWPDIPDDVHKACMIQAVQLFKAPDAVFGAIQLGEGAFATRVGKGLNPMAESLLEGYCLPRVG